MIEVQINGVAQQLPVGTSLTDAAVRAAYLEPLLQGAQRSPDQLPLMLVDEQARPLSGGLPAALPASASRVAHSMQSAAAGVMVAAAGTSRPPGSSKGFASETAQPLSRI